MKTYTVSSNHKDYKNLLKKAKANNTVKLSDGNSYKASLKDNKIVLAQTSTLKRVTLEDDKDLGKLSEDKTHSMAQDEQKPSEGVAKVDIPEAPNDGRLSREHTVDKPKDLPEIPTGGGMNEMYDTNEKNTPEKTDELLGNQGGKKASKDDIFKIAGELVKQNLISPNDLLKKVTELENASSSIINDYKNILASAKKGLQKEASGLEVPIVQKSTNNDNNSNLIQNLHKLSTLNKRNEDFKRFSANK